MGQAAAASPRRALLRARLTRRARVGRVGRVGAAFRSGLVRAGTAPGAAGSRLGLAAAAAAGSGRQPPAAQRRQPVHGAAEHPAQPVVPHRRRDPARRAGRRGARLPAAGGPGTGFRTGFRSALPRRLPPAGAHAAPGPHRLARRFRRGARGRSGPGCPACGGGAASGDARQVTGHLPARRAGSPSPGAPAPAGSPQCPCPSLGCQGRPFFELFRPFPFFRRRVVGQCAFRCVGLRQCAFRCVGFGSRAAAGE